MPADVEHELKSLWQHLTSERQSWLLGAGISYNAGIPNMADLTLYVRSKIDEGSKDLGALLGQIYSDLPDKSHIEHVMSQVGDLIALAERSRDNSVQVDATAVTAETLRNLHKEISAAIGDAVRYGYRAPRSGSSEVRGSITNPLAKVEDHRDFVKQVLGARHVPGRLTPPINFFTLNYDTLLEDAMALERIPYFDGFAGGATAFWRGYEGENTTTYRAVLCKMHGSVDWYKSAEVYLLRCRAGAAYPDRSSSVIIYPQATKYTSTQREPFAQLFASFREALTRGPDNVLAICGYSFGDEHVNDEIELSMGCGADLWW